MNGWDKENITFYIGCEMVMMVLEIFAGYEVLFVVIGSTTRFELENVDIFKLNQIKLL